MIYNKPRDTKYVDMCIYIDDHIYTEDYDEDLVFQYLYHLAFMLSKKYTYFNRIDDYDNFAIFAATRIFLRLTMKPDLPKIKSVLNYIKKVLPAYKVDYRNSEFSNVISSTKDNKEINYTFNNLISNHISDFSIAEFSLVFSNIPATCEKFLSSIPYKKNSSTWMNIYLSVMLTFMNTITLDKRQLETLDNLENTHYLQDYHLAEQYDKRELEKPILYHLPKHMENYILVLSRELRHIIADELSEILKTKVHSDYVLVEQYKDTFLGEISNDT